MPPVPDNVLNWLHGVLRAEYRDVNRTYSETAKTLAAYPSLRPKTEVYTYENGVSALLLRFDGTVPVTFRGQPYQFPVQIWVPHEYPRSPPICYVTPTDGMAVRPGQHVSGDGRIYHPYLAKWPEFWDKSSLLDLIAILRDVFAKEPPVMARQTTQHVQRPPVQATPTPPPPLPPPPTDDWRRPQHQSPQAQMGRPPPSPAGWRDGAPPPLPPKADGRSGTYSPMNGGTRSPNQGPPLPPLPPIHTQQQRPPPPPQNQWQDPESRAPPRPPYEPSRQSSLRNQSTQYAPDTALPPHMRHHELESPVSPISPPDQQAPQQQFRINRPQYGQHVARDMTPQNSYPLPQYAQQPPGQYQSPPPPHPNQYAPHQQPPPPHPSQYAPQYQHPPPQQPRMPQPQVDLLSSPLDVQLPGQEGSDLSSTRLPVPPVPPNPQKDALLNALSQALVSQANQTISNNNAAMQSLSAQHQALLAAQQTLQAELDNLAHLSSILDSNEQALRQGIQQIDTSIASASSQRRPEIDNIIIAPTVVGQQVYNAVAEEQACRDVRLALGRALDKGRVGVKEYVKEMRNVGREEFFKKALVRKAGVGMGLDVSSIGGG